MNKVIQDKLDAIIKSKAKQNRTLTNGVTEEELTEFKTVCLAELGDEIPEEYAQFLRLHNGMTIEGVFVYSTQRLPISGSSGKTLAFVEMNQFSRDLEGMNEFLFFGDSDQDEYVLEKATKKYQVRDKQAFSNVYEEFTDFDGILEFMLDMMIRRI
ncbi:hypothetical protein ALQ08_02190 [Pseudomonas syringae pv. delphinii]|uniref:Knr4/Smi1-like domain-containing protein n=1 Tax=Pseudomonas syringae pv. delphinii TaxID=192088 RepID=A0A0P9RYG5_9PSED|nr:YrhA family protein [Pseudomonas syringae group genomosp. 3]KPX17610.1 hypothetical protein ALO72_200246 [Pseudomonas syringae pv. delphinii]RMP23327.1 hypothetical protein ALQ27_200055 [Pseudomonas syringae pv. delphinii]RMQ21176.1 hypothetical protein ALQ08_02190 [Pseudomonas syringae pv. delphinii]